MSHSTNKILEFPIKNTYDILIIDDISLNIKLLRGILEAGASKHKIRIASSGEEALKLVNKKLPDLVLLDIIMPGMDGFEVCERLKTNPRSADVPVIFVSSLSEVDHKIEAFQAGAVDYITRPYEAIEVLVRVNNQLRLRDFYNRLEIKVRERTTELRNINSELQQSHHQLRELSAHLLNARETEKAQISREIHDEFGAVFTSLTFGLSWIKKHLPDNLPKISQRTDELREQVGQAASVARRIQAELRPTILDDLGLLEAISWQIDQYNKHSPIPCSLDLDKDLDNLHLPATHNVALFRILQESLTNVTRHSQASGVKVQIYMEENHFIMEIFDDGIGIGADPFTKKDSYGVRGMRERIWAIAGTITAFTRKDGGTMVRVKVPINMT